MDSEQLDALIRGKTLYHQLAPGSPQGRGEVPFYFGEDGRAAARLPDGRKMIGQWSIVDNAYRLDWNDGLKDSRTTLTKEGHRIVARNAKDGQIRSEITRVAPGNPEAL